MKGTVADLDQERLCLIPVHRRTKRPIPEKWQQRTTRDNNLNDFTDGSNVGVVLGKVSGNVVDIDLDSDIARQIGHRFLPATGWVFGRQSAPRSHFIYRSLDEPGSGACFKHNGRMVVEYRANGQQTVFPPSIHETGERIEFAELGEIGETTRARLLEAAGWITAAESVASHYVKGQRQATALALVGMLLAGGKDEGDILRFIDVVCDLTADEERSSRLEAVRSTGRRRADGQGFTQKRHLVELIGEQATDAICRHLGIGEGRTTSRAVSREGVLAADDMNDTGLAKQFSDHAKDRLLFVAETNCFHLYENGIWGPDARELAVARTFDEFIEHRIGWLRSHPQEVPHDQCVSQVKFLLRYRNRKNAHNAILQARPFVSQPLSRLDQRDDLIAVRNGVLNVHEARLLPFSPSYFITRRLDVTYEPAADCPAFKALLSDAFEGDEDLIRYMQGTLGYCLTGHVDRQEFYILHGVGNNGKSTLIEAVTYVFGPYAGTLMSETVFEGKGGQSACDLATMHGKRLAIAHEAESRFRLNAPLLKQLTGGDRVKTKGLYKDPSELVTRFKIVILCNKRPNLDCYDAAFRRRIKLIPFEYVVPREKRDAKLLDKLKTEASGILNFIIEGALMHARGEIHEPQAVRAATESYLADQDSVRSFLRDATIREPKATVGKGALYDAYSQYCADECLTPVSKKEFGTILLKGGCQDTRGASERQWKGLRLCGPEGGVEAASAAFPLRMAG